MAITIENYDCSTNTVTGNISGDPPDRVCAYGYTAPVSSIPTCPPEEATCVAWSVAHQGSGDYRIEDIARDDDNIEFEVVVWALWCESNSKTFDCSGGGGGGPE